MKIAIVTQYYSPEPILIPQTLAKALVSRGHEVRVLTGFPNYPDGEIFPGYKQRWRHIEQHDGVEVRRVPLFISHSYNPIARFANYLTFAASVAMSRRWVRSADVVYVYATQMTPAIGPSLWRRFFRTPYVMHVQDLWPESVTGSSMISAGAAKRVISAVLGPWLRHLYRTASATIAIAPSMGRMLVERGVPENRMHTVFNWATSEPGETDSRPTSEAGVSIVYAGNLGDHQDLDTVIEAAQAVRHLEGLRISIVGSGVAEKRLKARVHELGLRNVDFLGRVAPESMATIHARSDFQLVTLKDLEIFTGTIPSKLQASLANGVPVITTVRGDVKRIVHENGLGFACDPESVEQLAAAFTEAARLSRNERIQMGATARRFYMGTMSTEQGVNQIESILTSSARSTPRRNGWN